jgi:hypothetical protein
MTIEIDFQRIRLFGGSRQHGFEELCCQLASLELRPAGAVFYRKGLGADAGVECFLREADGAETGWQAKYFFGLGASQISQLDESINQAMTKHPRLDRYVVCIPFDLTDARVGQAKTELQRWQAWVRKWKGRASEKRRKLTIELWSKSDFVEHLTRDDAQYAGRLAYWFDETVLTPAWFRERFENAKASLGQRYTPETNVELPIRRAILAFCRDPSLIEEVERWGQKLQEIGYRAIERLKVPVTGADWTGLVTSLETAWTSLGRHLSGIPADPDFAIPLEVISAEARGASSITWGCMRAVRGVKTDDKNVNERLRHLGHELRQLEDVLSDIAESLEGERWGLVNSRRLLVFGEAGIGKSHLFGDANEYQISRDRPAVLILGGTLIEDDPWSQIIKQLGLQLSPERFLGALDAAAQAAGTRAVIFIDAINERHGIELWRERLAGFLRTIEGFPRVAIALSCRTIYLPYIVVDIAGQNLSRIEHVGFAGRAAGAASFYLERRGIEWLAAPNLVPEFENPLFLKTVCDYLDKEGLREIPRGLRGVTQLFEFYLEAVAKSVENRLVLDRSQKIVSRGLAALAEAFDQGERGYVELERANAILDGILPSHGQFAQSLRAQLESEGILTVEPVTSRTGVTGEIVRFTFERLSDHRIAKQVLDKHLGEGDPKKFFLPGTPLHEYLNKGDAYKHAGVIEALAIQLPERCGLELQDALPPRCINAGLLSKALLNSVLWRDQKRFTKRTLQLAKEAGRLTGEDELTKVLIAIATEPDNAFNALFLHDRLKKLSMPDRDQTWSIYLAQEGASDDGHVQSLISWAAQNGLVDIEEQRAELAAIALSWLFSTSNREIRDRATKALASLLSIRLSVGARLIQRFQNIDDAYILERVLASAYGAALQGLTLNGLTELAEAAFASVFEREPPLVHMLIRDYARGIIELAHARGVLSQRVDINKARPPYRSPWPIEEVSEETVESYKQDYPGGHRFTDQIVASAVNDGDFARYVTDGPVSNFTRLPLECAGMAEEAIYVQWRDKLLGNNPEAENQLREVIKACDALRDIEASHDGPLQVLIRFVEPGDKQKKEEQSAEEQSIEDAEARLRDALGEAGWQEYCDRARSYVRRGIYFTRHIDSWPPAFSAMAARRWICKRAHDYGWTPERFGEFDRHTGSYSRNDHRLERIGKKYQWLSFHELMARLADNVAFKGDWRDKLSAFDGPWQIGRRDIDPSLLAARKQDNEWYQWDATWWMPVRVKLKPISAQGRLSWLDGRDDFTNGESLISVTDPKAGRNWLVVDEFALWNQWGVREGDRRLDRDTWFRLKCVIVHAGDRRRLVEALSGRSLSSDRDLPRLERPMGYVGEYAWHPMYAGLSNWVQPDDWHKLGAEVQPLVTEYLAEKGGHDYSIDESLRLDMPEAGLIAGLELHLSNGKELSYSDDSGKVMFFDPTIKEPGPRAALVDRDAFLNYLKREGLEAVWVIACEKEVRGGKPHGHGYGGSRSRTSIYWLTDSGFEHQDYFSSREPSEEQLEIMLAEDPGYAPTAVRSRSAKPPQMKQRPKKRKAAGSRKTVGKRKGKATKKITSKKARGRKKRRRR